MALPACEIREFPDGSREFLLAERELSWIRIDFQARLQLGDAELVIETPFRLAVDEHEHALDPNDRGGLGPLLALYPDAVERVTMSSDGTLEAIFASSAR